MEICTSKIFPSQFQITQLAGQDLDGFGFVYALLLCQRHPSVGVAVEKCEMPRRSQERRCEASRPFRVAGPSVRELARGMNLVRVREQSTLRYRRKPPVPAASTRAMSIIMLIGRSLRIAVPNSDDPCGSRLEHDLADCVAISAAMLRFDRAAALRNPSCSSFPR